MNTETGTLDALVQEKLDADTDFLAEIEDLEDDEREKALEDKRKEILEAEFASLSDTAKKNGELAQNYKTRAEKAEKNKPEVAATEEQIQKTDSDLSTKDIYALTQAQVHIDDVDEVVKAAKLLSLSVQEALKDPVVKSILDRNTEVRKTANATNHGRNPRGGTKKIDQNEILREASKGNIPEPGTPEAEALFRARRGI